MSGTPAEPYDSGRLDVGDGNLVYWETCGNPAGLPVLRVHGGPGSGCTAGMRRFPDTERHRVILFDQRGCGRSTPSAGDPATDLTANTTGHLVSDMERLREHLGVERWVLSGGSWGVTLALAYAERYPQRVSGLLLASVTSCRRAEINWLYRGVGQVFPEAWARFRDFAGAAGYGLPTDSEPAVEGLLLAYGRLLASPDRPVREAAARAWLAWEDAVISMESAGTPGQYSARPDDQQVTFARLCAHYYGHGAFLADGILIREAGRLAGIPGILIHGRGDLGGPVITAWELARAWPGAELTVIEGAGHTGSGEFRAAMIRGADRLHGLVTGSLT